MSDPTNDIPRSAKLFQVFWPVALALLVSGASMVQASSKIEVLASEVQELKLNGPPITRERLARMEAKQDAQAEVLVRMEAKLDDLDKRSREINLRGL